MSSNSLDFFALLALEEGWCGNNHPSTPPTPGSKITVPVLLLVQKVSTSQGRHIDLKALILAKPHSCLCRADYILE